VPRELVVTEAPRNCQEFPTRNSRDSVAPVGTAVAVPDRTNAVPRVTREAAMTRMRGMEFAARMTNTAEVPRTWPDFFNTCMRYEVLPTIGLMDSAQRPARTDTGEPTARQVCLLSCHSCTRADFGAFFTTPLMDVVLPATTPLGRSTVTDTTGALGETDGGGDCEAVGELLDDALALSELDAELLGDGDVGPVVGVTVGEVVGTSIMGPYGAIVLIHRDRKSNCLRKVTALCVAVAPFNAVAMRVRTAPPVVRSTTLMSIIDFNPKKLDICC
jgi:hypothetical protein